MSTRARRSALAMALAIAALVPSTATGQSTAVAVPEGVRRPVTLVDIGAGLGLSRDSHSWDLVVARVNDDPVPDLVVADHDKIQVWINHRPGLQLAEPVRELIDPHGCAVADVDGNGLNDLYCTQGAERGVGHRPNRLWLQTAPDTWSADQGGDYGVTDQFGRGRRTTFADFDHEGGPDLFVGNQVGRTDGELSVNRTFLNGEGPPMALRRLGPLGDKGAVCVQAVDQNRDGWQDLLLCGGSNQAGQGNVAADNRLYLYRNQPAAGGGRRLVSVAGQLGIALEGVRAARLARLNGDGILDLVVVGTRRVTVWPGNRRGGFDRPTYARELRAGNWVAIGDVDGRRGNDLFIVQGCTRAGNVRDLLLLHGEGWEYREVLAPPVGRGCGDTAAMLDIGGDGAHEIVVGNGRWASHGPLQVLTAGTWRP